MVGRQSDQVVEYTSFTRSVGLECTNAFVSFFSQIAVVIVHAHQFGTVIGRNIFACSGPAVVRLLTEVQCPVERWAVVVNQLSVWHDFFHAVNHVRNFLHVWCGCFNPQQVSAVLQSCHTVEHNAVDLCVFAELVQARCQACWAVQFAITFDQYFVIVSFRNVDFCCCQVADVLRR